MDIATTCRLLRPLQADLRYRWVLYCTTCCYRPDKAIDLVDDATSALRLAQESKTDDL